MGAAYDVFGNGKTALKVNLGKYLQGASVSNLAYGYNPVLRLPYGTGLSTTGLCLFGGLGFTNPCVARSWVDLNGTSRRIATCRTHWHQDPAPVRTSAVRSTTRRSARRSSRRSSIPTCFPAGGAPVGLVVWRSVQQQLFPRASVEVGYYRRSLTQYATSGTVTDNLAISPNDVGTFYLTRADGSASSRRWRLPDRPAYDINPGVSGA